MNPPNGTPKAQSPSESSPDEPEETAKPKAGPKKSTRGTANKIGNGPAKRRPMALGAPRLRAAAAAQRDEAADGGGGAGGGKTGGRGGRGSGPGPGRFGGKGPRGGRAAQQDAVAGGVLTLTDRQRRDAAIAGPELAEDQPAEDQPVEDQPAGPVQAESVPGGSVQAALVPAVVPASEISADQADEAEEVEPTTPGQIRRRPLRGGPKRGPAAAKAGRLDLTDYEVSGTVGPAVLRRRHYGVIALFVLMVIVPTVAYAWYLWNRAADQYESDVGFGSRTEEAASTFDFLGVLGGASSSSSKDMDILNQFIISQDLVDRIDRKLDLRTMYSKPQNDPLGAFDPKGTIENLVDYWQRMVVINYDSGTGLMNLQVFAFDPLDAQNIAVAVLDESTATINALSATAQDDTTRYSKEALTAAEERLSKARLALTDFRVKNQIVDPSSDLASQSGIINTLNQQMAAAQIDLDLLTGTAAANDPRVAQLTRRIEVIANRIAEEQAKVGAVSSATTSGYALLVSDYERLQVDNDFAQKAYLSALAAYDLAVTDAQHKTRYLATYVAPTLAEAPTAPNRPLNTALIALVGFLTWSILVLVYYALRDRR